MSKIMSPVIPGLIDDLARECLIRMPYQDLPTASSVCRSWRVEITGPELHRFRKVAGVSRPVIIIAQAKTDDLNLGQDGMKNPPSRPTYQLTICDPGAGTWTRLPMIPGKPDGLPMFCGLVGLGSDIYIFGGWDPVTWRASSEVYIYSFLSGKWRKGADMPGVRRSFFGFATSDEDRTVVIAGGHDEDKNALKSALLYEVDNDKWVPLPDMERPRDECKAIFHRGRFHVISGYPTDAQGCFERSAEVFDTATGQWGPVMEDFLEASANPATCVAGLDGKVYACVSQNSGDVAVCVDDRWQVIAKVPTEVRSSKWVVAYEASKMMVIGSTRFGEAHNGYGLDLKSYKWCKVDVPIQFSGHVQCACVLQL